MQIPINEKSSLNLMHGFITFQIYLNTTKSFTIEIAITDTNNGKKRILLSACSKEFIKNQLHCRIPIINIPTGIWINFSIDILSFVSECFKGQSFRAIDSICLSADCKIRRICGMRQLYTLSLEEYLQGDDTVLPKGFVLPNEIKYVNINFDMNYIKQTVEIKNIKNNDHMNTTDKKTYPKTSQSKRDVKLFNNFNNNGNKIIRNNIKSKSINKQRIKNNIDKDLTKSKNKYNLKEFSEINKGSTKKIKNLNDKNDKNDKNKNEQKESNKLMKTSKPEKKYKNNFIRNKSKEKLNSKSVGKVYVKSKTNNAYINKKVNSPNNVNNNNLNEKNKQNDITIKKNNNNNTINNKLSSQINNNQVIINNNIKNNNLPKEEVNLFNTFNYKDLESKENTLLINQSNFNNASIPEIVDLEANNNTYLKNIENDINYNYNNNDIILLDNNNKDNDNNILINHEHMDSLIVEKLISDINDNKNERPYTPPLQKIIPVGNENNSNLNNINISQINESLIQNHYNDLVYDKETGRYYDKKTKIFYDFK